MNKEQSALMHDLRKSIRRLKLIIDELANNKNAVNNDGNEKYFKDFENDLEMITKNWLMLKCSFNVTNSFAKTTNQILEKVCGKGQNKITVFCVDDDELMRNDFIKALSKINLKSNNTLLIVGFESAESVMEAFQKGNIPDIVFTDQNMLKLDGLSLVKWLREEKFTKKIYMLTNHSKKEFEKKALAAGADGHFQIPIDQQELEQLFH